MRAPTTRKPIQGTGDVLSAGFTLTLDNFEGPFDLLLSLISRRKLDITEVALAEVTDEFLSYINALFTDKDDDALDIASDFLVTATTLLDLKAARLLPRATPETEEDIALLEARDLLFARLLQYRAYREVATILSEKFVEETTRFTRDVELEPQFTQILPELIFNTTPQDFAAIAAKALSTSYLGQDGVDQAHHPRVELEHLRTPLTTVSAEESYILEALKIQETQTFSQLIVGCGAFEIAVFRFLAVLELLKNGAIDVEQTTPQAEIKVRIQEVKASE